ncbi:MAG: prepilin-type N-terminal cleavage/methylation domain-containing protein [Cyanobacteria bacterium]|jgi:prepilin-type N-terminal cleavage/methylation domain-containing protein|nr:prepilin-type N-terminal cleavage/methylation domain-containing protein [Cyanobacteria bacterium GSL.Bin1]
MFNSLPKKSSIQGFTLLEVLAITVIIGILAGIAAPSWFGFMQRQRLNTAQDEVFRAIQQAQQKARQESTSWQVSFREATVDGETVVQWRTEEEIDADPDPFLNNVTGGWNSLDSRINLGKINFESDNASSPTAWRIQFDYKGRALGDDGFYQGTIVLSAENISDKRCVIISDLLGTLREAKDEECS